MFYLPMVTTVVVAGVIYRALARLDPTPHFALRAVIVFVSGCLVHFITRKLVTRLSRKN